MRAGKLQNSLALESVFQGLFANGAFAAYKCSFAPQAASIGGARHDVVVNGTDSALHGTGG